MDVVSYLGIIDSSEHVELLLLLLFVQFLVRINCGDLKGEKLFDLLMLFSHAFLRLNRGVIVVAVDDNLCGGTFNFASTVDDDNLKVPAEVFVDEKFDIFTLFSILFFKNQHAFPRFEYFFFFFLLVEIFLISFSCSFCRYQYTIFFFTF